MSSKFMLDKDEINSTLPPIEGAKIIGKLDDPLIAAYVELANAEFALDDISDVMIKRAFSKSLQQIENATSLGYEGVATALTEIQGFESEDEAIDMFRRIAEWDELRACFWNRVRMTFNVWNHWLEIRSDFRVVSLGKKFQAK
jgi:hypothetical protein